MPVSVVPAAGRHCRNVAGDVYRVIADIVDDAGILACDHDDRHKGAHFDRHLTTDPQ